MKKKKQPKESGSFVSCTLKMLPIGQSQEAAHRAVKINPINAVHDLFLAATTGLVLGPEHLAVLTSKYWGAGGVDLTVGFPFDNPAQDVRDRILLHMNAWGQWANVKFRETRGQAQVRIARTRGSGYWSYLGTDVLSISVNEPTMNLDSFTMQTSESEYRRVVRHETGHTLGFPHEHLRRELVARLDPQKTIAYFQRTQGWSRQMVIQQVLTPLEEASLLGTPHADQASIMCYQLPVSITVDGKPIVGGVDIDEDDQAVVARLYPLAGPPPPPPPPTAAQLVLTGTLGAGTYSLTKV